MESDVQTTRLTADGYVTGSATQAQPARVKAVYYVASGTAGTIALTDGSGGSTLVTIDTPAAATATDQVWFPDNGIRFKDRVYLDLTAVSFVTVVWAA